MRIEPDDLVRLKRMALDLDAALQASGDKGRMLVLTNEGLLGVFSTFPEIFAHMRTTKSGDRRALLIHWIGDTEQARVVTIA
jgi:hypothetical protein